MTRTAPLTTPKPLVELCGVGFALAGQTILHGVDFTLEQGQCWGLLGQSGAGKSNFLRILRGEAWPSPGAGSRRYVVDGREQTSPIAFRAKSRLVSSELLDRYQRLRLSLNLRELVRTGFDDSVYLHHRLDDAKEARVEETLAQLGILDLAGRRLDALSRGQSRKALLARALVARPEALFLDECCEDLDTGSAALMLGHAGRNGRRRGDHRIRHPSARGVDPGLGAHRAFRKRDHHPKRNPPGDGAGDKLLRPGAGVHSRPGPRPAAAPEPMEYVARLENADIYLDRRKVLTGVNWRLDPGRHWVVWGENGAGKTTLLKLLAGELQPAVGGDIHWFGRHQQAEPLETAQANKPGLGPVASPGTNTARPGWKRCCPGFTGSIGTTRHQPSRREIKAARFWLDFLGIPHLAERDVLDLSYGQMRGLLLARAMVTDPKLLLLDEPLAGLDPNFRGEVTAMLRRLAGQGVAIVLVTHHHEDLFPELTNLLVLEKGRISYQGPLQSLFHRQSGSP